MLIFLLKKNKWTHKIYFLTDLEVVAKKYLRIINHIYRWHFCAKTKQQTSLNYCQARSENKLHPYFNMALTSVNLEKITLTTTKRKPFSMSNVKVGNSNDLHLNK